MGGCCSGEKEPKAGNTTQKPTPQHNGCFAELVAESKRNPRVVKEGNLKEAYIITSGPIDGLVNTCHGEHSQTKQKVVITQIEYTQKMTKAQAAALVAMLKHKPGESILARVSVDAVYYEACTLSLVSEVRTASMAAEAIAGLGEDGVYDEDIVAAVIFDVASAMNDLHKRKLVQGNLQFEGLLADLQPKPKKVQAQIPTFNLFALSTETTWRGKHKGIVPPEVLLNDAQANRAKLPGDRALQWVQLNEQTDAWNLGVLLHMMLVGYPPLQESEEGVKTQIEKMKEGDDFPIAEHYWSDISPDARDLVVGLLRVDPSKRFTVETVLDDPWITTPGRTGTTDLRESKRKLIEANTQPVQKSS